MTSHAWCGSCLLSAAPLLLSGRLRRHPHTTEVDEAAIYNTDTEAIWLAPQSPHRDLLCSTVPTATGIRRTAVASSVQLQLHIHIHITVHTWRRKPERLIGY